MQPEHLVHLFTTVHGSDLQRLLGAYADHVRALSPRYKAVICRSLHRSARQRGDSAETVSSPGSGAAPLHAAMHEVSAIANILLSTTGCELTELKNRLDSAESSHDLLNLCALLPPGLRDHVMRHVQREALIALREWNEERRAGGGEAAGAATAATADGGGEPAEEACWWPAKVYCDFDDTVQVRWEGVLVNRAGHSPPPPLPPHTRPTHRQTAGPPVGPLLPGRHGLPGPLRAAQGATRRERCAPLRRSRRCPLWPVCPCYRCRCCHRCRCFRRC